MAGRDFDLADLPSMLVVVAQTLSLLLLRVIPMVFQHSGGRDFDLPRHSHYSGVIPVVFQHSGGRDLTFPDTLTTRT